MLCFVLRPNQLRPLEIDVSALIVLLVNPSHLFPPPLAFLRLRD